MRAFAEFIYNLGALALVATFAYFFFWGFLAVVGPSVLISLALMTLERFLS